MLGNESDLVLRGGGVMFRLTTTVIQSYIGERIIKKTGERVLQMISEHDLVDV